MRLQPLSLLAVVALLFSGAAGDLSAQIGFQSAEISGGWAAWAGDDFDGLDPGLQLQGAVLAEVTNRFSLGLDGTIGFVSVGEEGFDNSDVTQYGIGARGRVALGEEDALHLFVDAHLGWTRLDINFGGLDLVENGVAVGPGIGVQIPTSRSFSVVVAADAHYHNYNDLQLAGAGTGGPIFGDPGTAGWRYSLRAGLLLRGSQ